MLISLPKAVSPKVVIPLLSVTHGQCDSGPTHCQTSSATHRYRLTVSVASLKHSCLQTRIGVHSALDIFLLMRYVNLHLLTYLLTTVTFPAAKHHRPLAGTELYCLVTEAHVC